MGYRKSMKTVNGLTPQNEVKDKVFSKDCEHVMDMSALSLIVFAVLILVPSLILFLVISFREKIS